MRCLLFALLLLPAAYPAEAVSARRIRAHVRFLSHDLLEGRAPGTRGGRVATEYIATQFALAGTRPAGDAGGWFQTVPLVGVTTQPGVSVAAVGEESMPLNWLDDIAGATGRQQEAVEFSSEAVFAGYGISAPEYNWDDYGGVDVNGKVVLLFANEPKSESDDFFDGKALTYYGRWTYKLEQALARGATAAILLHTDETAGYGWDVVRGSWGREAIQVPLAAGAPALAFSGWITKEAAERWLSLANLTVEQLLDRANTRGFRAAPLGFHIEASVPSKVRTIETRNVLAMVPGSDPERRREAVLFAAHWDHLGVGPQTLEDRIFNGAIDNATGTAMLLEMARVWAALDKKPGRSALFVAVTAEESGLLGSEHYVRHPAFPLGRTAAALNFDSYLPLGTARSITLNGAERTTVQQLAAEAARRLGLAVKPARRTGRGGYFRSDHFSFARAGVPAFSIAMGRDFAGKSPEWIAQQRKRNGYHQPSDEYREDWDFSGLAQVGEYGVLLGRMIADMDGLPTWNAGDPYLKPRNANRR